MQVKKIKGFSLVELLVANSIFAVVIILSISTIFALNQVSTRQKTARVVFEDMNVMLDSMTKDIRQGNTYGCIKDAAAMPISQRGVDCPISYSSAGYGIGVEFVSQEDTIYSMPGGSSVRTRFYMQGDKIVISKITVDATGSIISATTPEVISGDNITIKEFYVHVSGSADSNPPSNDYLQPIVHIRIIGNKVSSENDGKIKDFDIYTSVSQRESDS